MRAILIDPFARTITEVEHNGDYREIYKLLSHETMPVDCFDCVRLDDGDAIYVDDEGLLKPCKAFFVLHTPHGMNGPYAGKGLVLGSDDEGESASAKMPLSKLQDAIQFVSRDQLNPSWLAQFQ